MFEAISCIDDKPPQWGAKFAPRKSPYFPSLARKPPRDFSLKLSPTPKISNLRGPQDGKLYETPLGYPFIRDDH